MRRYIPLIVWVLVIIYPSTTYLESTPSGSLLNLAYRSEAAHIITHLFVFAILALLLVRAKHASPLPKRAHSLKLQLNWNTVLGTLLFTLLIGLVQEGLQYMVSADRVFGWPEIYDLGVDVIGGILGLGLIYLWRLRRSSHEL